MRRSASAFVAAGALSLLAIPLASPASATAPARACPPPFMLLTYEQQVELAEELSVPIEDVLAAIDKIDKNGDRALCFAFQNKNKGGPNIIDNVANAHM